MREQINIESLERAIRIWEEMINCYRDNMAAIKREHRLTWWLRWDFWKNDKYFHVAYTGLISRRIQLQTAIRDQRKER